MEIVARAGLMRGFFCVFRLEFRIFYSQYFRD